MPLQQTDIKRIALIGPESTGKTTLCSELAAHYNTCWVPEYSRDYIGALNRPYTLDDIILCTKNQLKEEERLIPLSNRFLFSDTELIIAKVWMEDVFHEAPSWVNAEIDKRKFDLYLLTDLDLPFENDPVRENPHRRDYFFGLYKQELEKRNFPFVLIRGNGNERLQQAIAAVSGYFR